MAKSSQIFSLLSPESTIPFSGVPIIDITDAWSSDLSARREVAFQVRKACIEVGFFYVSNHRVPQAKVEKAIDQAKQFFDEPLDRKMQIDIHKTANFKGYCALLGENADPENRGDMHEAFNIGPENPNDTGTMRGLNQWPIDLPGFKAPVLDLYNSLVDLGKVIFHLFALALDLPEDFFDDKTKNAAAVMRLLHYPPQTGIVDDRVVGIGAHTDYECFTILWQDEVPALQVLNTANQWIDAKPIPGTLVLNIGDQFARWTNDIFKSTRHRVINRSGVRRYSVPLFFGTDYDVKLEALPTCVTPERPARYDPNVTAGEYVKSKLEATYNAHQT